MGKPYTLDGSESLENADAMFTSLYARIKRLEKLAGVKPAETAEEAAAVAAAATPLTNPAHWLTGPWILDSPQPTDHIAVVRQDPVASTTYHDYAPQGIDTAVCLELEPTGSGVTITGVRNAKMQRRLLGIVNRDSSFSMTLAHDTGSTDRWRFKLPGNADIVLGPGQAAWMYYNLGSEKWQLFITPHTSGGLSSGTAVTTVTVALSEAAIEAGNSGMQLVAGTAGKIVIPIHVLVKVVVTTQYTSNPVWSLRWAGITQNISVGASLVLSTNGTKYARLNCSGDDLPTADPTAAALNLFLNANPTGAGTATGTATLAYLLIDGF